MVTFAPAQCFRVGIGERHRGSLYGPGTPGPRPGHEVRPGWCSALELPCDQHALSLSKNQACLQLALRTLLPSCFPSILQECGLTQHASRNL